MNNYILENNIGNRSNFIKGKTVERTPEKWKMKMKNRIYKNVLEKNI